MPVTQPSPTCMTRCAKPGMAVKGELAMLAPHGTRQPRRLTSATLLRAPPTGVLVRAPSPQLSTVNGDAASQKVLTQHFRDITTDPEVCESIVRATQYHTLLRGIDCKGHNFFAPCRQPWFLRRFNT